MNRTVLVAFCAGILGAVVGAAFVVSFTTPAREMPSEPLSPGELEGAFRAALTPLRQSLERGFSNLEVDLRAGFAMPVRVPVAEADPAADPAAEASPVADAHGTRAPVARRPGSGLPPPRPWAFEALRNWKEDPEVRRTWLFAPEADVLRNFGTPDYIDPAGLQERWAWYVYADGEKVGQHHLMLNKGRVVSYFNK